MKLPKDNQHVLFQFANGVIATGFMQNGTYHNNVDGLTFRDDPVWWAEIPSILWESFVDAGFLTTWDGK